MQGLYKTQPFEQNSSSFIETSLLQGETLGFEWFWVGKKRIVEKRFCLSLVTETLSKVVRCVSGVYQPVKHVIRTDKNKDKKQRQRQRQRQKKDSYDVCVCEFTWPSKSQSAQTKALIVTQFEICTRAIFEMLENTSAGCCRARCSSRWTGPRRPSA